jgi:biotin carboxylase
VLGASDDQLYLIRTAQKMGLRVFAVDIDESAPGLVEADDRTIVSTRDVQGLKELLDQQRASGIEFAGVTTMGSDIPQVVAELAGYLGTPSVSAQSAAWTTDKYAMKCRLREQGIPVPDFREVGSENELQRAAEDMGLPVVVKPVDRSGARGVSLARDSSRLAEFYAEANGVSFAGRVMVERFVPGLQISTETVMDSGQGVTPGFADRNYEYLERFEPRIIENGGWVPSVLGAADRAAVEELVVRASLALGIDTGVTKGDVVMAPSGPMLIEMAARLSGGDFSESLVPLSSGVNYVEAAIKLAIGEELDLGLLAKPATQAVANRYFFPPPGRLVALNGLDEVRAQPWVRKLETWYRLGEIVPSVGSHAQRFGVFVVVGEDRAELDARVRWVYETVRIETVTRDS